MGKKILLNFNCIAANNFVCFSMKVFLYTKEFSFHIQSLSYSMEWVFSIIIQGKFRPAKFRWIFFWTKAIMQI